MSTNKSERNPDAAFPSGRRGPGRPRDLEKREAILAAASALFSERGIAATTMDLVAERAGAAKMTIYAHFADKPALLAAVFERNTRDIRLPEFAEGEDLPSSLAHLNEFGEWLVQFLTRPDIVKSAKTMVESADLHPELAAAFYAAGPAAMIGRVSDFLRSITARALLSVEEPELVAEQLVAAWLGVSQLQQNLGVAGPPSSEAIAKRVRAATGALARAWPARR
ncbi:MAG TPA: TetR/AcrR family transcriptional regulator [Roseiarcus sp.]